VPSNRRREQVGWNNQKKETKKSPEGKKKRSRHPRVPGGGGKISLPKKGGGEREVHSEEGGSATGNSKKKTGLDSRKNININARKGCRAKTTALGPRRKEENHHQGGVPLPVEDPNLGNKPKGFSLAKEKKISAYNTIGFEGK